MTSSGIRSSFLDAFSAWEHTRVPSSPLVTVGDPTLLFTNAGMVQFKSVFLGTETRPYRRAVSVQRCLRAGGKHNDLDQVGQTARHHTFFEMLGNFSFGDYFKAEAVEMAWTLLARQFGLPASRLWATVFRDDDVAEALWKAYLPAGRIVRLGEKDNFWQMGDTGPCGPCSEILIDQGEGVHADCPGIGRCDCDRYLEIWNLVFMQYNRGADGVLTPLPAPSIDTGMGLERLTAVCQGVASNYDSDLFAPLFSALATRAGRLESDVRAGVPGRVIADHLRAITFLIADGVIPSNEGAGYVLRRILRRAARFGKKIGLDDPFLHALTDVVVQKMGAPYPELVAQSHRIAQVVLNEETRFLQTLHQGMARVEEAIEHAQRKGETVLSGGAIFVLYDTYGFPVDLACEMAREVGLSVDLTQFETAMETQKERARRSWVGSLSMIEVDGVYAQWRQAFGPTNFTGYERLEEEATLLAILKAGQRVEVASAGDAVELLFDLTPFYGEGGGQVGDCGTLTAPGVAASIEGAVKPLADLHVHRAQITCGVIEVGRTYRLAVEGAVRRNTARNHTATHLLHAALKEVLGDHVHQAGSRVAPDRLRFDFRHFAPVTLAQMDRIEGDLNARIHQGMSVQTEVMDTEAAVATGAVALFGEKYGARARVVQIADVSRELCGGTHCGDTAQIGLFKIGREGGVAAGIRRIEAVTGPGAYQWTKAQEARLREAADRLKSTPEDVARKIDRLMAQARTQESQMERLRAAATQDAFDVQKIGALSVIVQTTAPMDAKSLRAHADRLRDRLKSGVVAVGAPSPDGSVAAWVVMVTPDWTARLSAADLIKAAARHIDGAGGGSPAMAQAGGKNPAGLDSARAAVAQAIAQRIGAQDT